MVLNSQIRKVVLRWVTGEEREIGAYPFMHAVELVSFVREEHVFEEISTGPGK